ncbi:MAG TPA: S8 family peptidase [Bryobacteraceae bacterium]|nr:S8 family peptidase [Bryobacteraceae bacterium]
MRKTALWIMLWGSLLAGTLYADRHKFSKDLADKLGQGDADVDVIVQYQQDPSDSDLAKLPAKKARVKEHWKRIRAVSVTAPASALDALSDDANVVYVTPDREVRAQFDYSEQTINAPYAWQTGLDGTGVGVAVVDSGVADVDDLEQANSNKSRVVYREVFNGRKGDEYGHGTHVAGILAGNGKDSTGKKYTMTFKGVAPNANLIDLEVLDRDGSSTDSAVIKAIHRAIDLKNKYNIRVLNLSLGRPVEESCTLDPLCQAVAAAWKAGIVVVTSAGNLGRNGYASILSPGNSPYAITVGAMKTMGTPARGDDLIASYSSKGPTWVDMTLKPDLVAPGNQVVSLLAENSTLANNYPQNIVPLSSYSTAKRGDSNYFTLSGTSMAAPMVSGAAALMIQQDPTLTPDTVKARLMQTASKNFPATSVDVDSVTGTAYTSQYDAFTVGAGYLDIMGALASTDVATAGTLSPTVFYDPASGNAYIVDDSTQVWVSSQAFRTIAIWGTNEVSSAGSPVQGTIAIWGTKGGRSQSVSGTIAIWGSRQAWIKSSSWGTTAIWGTADDWGTLLECLGE